MEAIRGITWDHPRGYEPLRAAAAHWQAMGKPEVKWHARTLKEFGDCPIETLINTNDLIILDHPYVGNAASGDLLVPLDEVLPAAFLEVQRKESIGEGFESYWYAHHCWALPIDAAAQVAACRKDLTDPIGWELPEDIRTLPEAAMKLPGNFKMAIPLCPTDAWCVFLTLCAQYGNGKVFGHEGIDIGPASWSLAQIRHWRSFLHPASFAMNPVQMLDYMSVEDDIIYVPFIFGYTNYARIRSTNKRIHFANVPKYDPSGKSSILGGAGLAVSAKTNHLKECLQFVEFALSVEVQKGLYYQNGGQPAHLSAWLDEENNRDCSCFFYDTLDTLQHAYVRPRHPGFNRFQERAADLIHEHLTSTSPEGDVINKLNHLYRSIVHDRL